MDELPELLLDATALSRSVRGRFRRQQARFPDFRLKRVASRPSQSRVRSVTLVWKLRLAGTQWREPSGHFTQLPLSPSWAPATVQPDDVELKQRLLGYKEQVSVVDEATLYVYAQTCVKTRRWN